MTRKPDRDLIIIIASFVLVWLVMGIIAKYGKTETIKSVWVDTWSDSVRHGRFYNGLIKINDNQYLFLIKRLDGTVFDSTIITINK